MKKRTAGLLVGGVLILSVLGGFFVVPNSILPSFYNASPWKLGLDLVGGSYLIYHIDLTQIEDADTKEVAAGLRDVIENRVNAFGVSEPRVTVSQSSDEYFLNVELAGISDISQAIEQIGLTPFLEFREVRETEEGIEYIATDLTGRYIKSAAIDYDPNTGRPYVAMELKGEGIDIFEDLTARNIGKQLAIFLDGRLLSAPVVQNRISGGSAQISGDFTIEEIRGLVRNLNIGALPAPIELVNQQTVGASLGRDALQKSLVAGAIGTGLVIVFMALYYGLFGILAGIALLTYIILSLSIFKLLVTMSLAGIAGFLLSVGMAVDANILIFERTKEELKKGVMRVAAVREGFVRAWPSIRDSNITTIITTLILFYFTASFVKGLALTLLIGVIISMFTAIVVTRGLMVITIRNKKDS